MAKYEAIQGYWVYSIQIPSINKYYIGVSKQKCCNRWQKARYKGMALEPYLEEWDSMKKTVLVDGLTKTEALKMEDDLIQALKMNNLTINSNRSGLIEVSDVNAYMKQWHEDNPEYNKQYVKQYIENNPEYYEQHKERVKQYQKQRYENDVEYREHEKQRSKQYYENNKEKILERNKEKRLKKKLEKQHNQQLNLFS